MTSDWRVTSGRRVTSGHPQVVGLYRLCGSAAAKKELREAFERDSAAVTLSEHLWPDINVVTGLLKDFLRELPCPQSLTPQWDPIP
ncbi:hypothetical protein TURU_102944 [Turdus rufiventris]|nr:hypothetical protein TURU_102944 [Turdus rufiventris]